MNAPNEPSQFRPVPRPPQGALDLSREQTMSPRERGCTSKAYYASAGEAELAALERMVKDADAPLGVYACNYCTGFHLTSSDQESENTVDLELPVLPQEAEHLRLHLNTARASEDFRTQKQRWRRNQRQIRRQRAKQNLEKAKAFQRSEPPRLASPEEVAAFFAAHAPRTAD